MAFKIPSGSLGKLFKQPFCVGPRWYSRNPTEHDYHFVPVGPNALARFLDWNACSTLIPHPKWLCALRLDDKILKTLQNLLEAYNSGQQIPYTVKQGENQCLYFTYTGKQSPVKPGAVVPQNMTPTIPLDFRIGHTEGSATIHEPVYASGDKK